MNINNVLFINNDEKIIFLYTNKKLKLFTFYLKLKFFENFIIKCVKKLIKAAPRFELGIKDLQSSALPLGHAAEKDSIESLYDLNSKVSHSLLFICNGHGEDVIASEIIKRLLKK